MLDDLKEILAKEKNLTLKIKVHALAKQNKVKSVLVDGTIKVDIRKAPESGKANEELIDLLSKEFSVKPSQVNIFLGKFSSDKIVKIKV